ncbi:MAG: hypothetical protein ABI665_15155 [Vicinamibacterales bacterium]
MSARRSLDPNQILVWAQVGAQMTQLVVAGIGSVQAMIAASGASAAEQQAALDRTHALYQAAIAHEQAIVDAGSGGA